MIKTQIVADSVNMQGDRLTTMLITLPRIILAELNSHRMLSKNSASSRAIPFNKMVEAVQNNPFIPIAWQKDHKGMQGTEYLTDRKHENAVYEWLKARDYAVKQARMMNNDGVTKQLCNRPLEPFMWHTVIVTATEWENFFALRCPKYEIVDKINEKEYKTYYRSRKDWLEQISSRKTDYNVIPQNEIEWLLLNKGQAEIHMMALAEAMWNACNESTPKQLREGEWHIPFENSLNYDKIFKLRNKAGDDGTENETLEDIIKISTAMLARTSYTTVGDEKEVSYDKLIELHDKLINQKPFHASPFEHCARAMSNEEYISYHKGIFVSDDSVEAGMSVDGDLSLGWCRNFKGFIQYRHILETKNK